jgi:hypothetical protein
VNLSRAYEIALLGNFKIQIVFNKEYKQGFEDYDNIKSFYNEVDFVKEGDLIIEIYKPDYNQNTERFETKEDIKSRVEMALKNKKPNSFKNNSCDTLLKTATDKLGFTLQKREKVIEISKTIAQLDGSTAIEPHHIAEAIHYNCYDKTQCNAENKSINFGDGIQIALYDLDYTDVENAINYLSELVKK